MAVASIKSTRNGDPTTSLVDSSREDLVDGDVITLESIGVGATTHSWSILFSPHYSSVGLTSTNTAVTQFAVDKEGSYLIRLMVDAGLPTESSQHLRLRALTEFGGIQLVAAGERRDEEAIIPTDIGIYGWAYEQNGNIRKILDFLKPIVQSGRVVHVDSGSDNYGDFPNIQEAIDFCVLEGASESSPFVVLVREGVYEETLTLKPFVHIISTQHKNTSEIPDLTSKPKLSPRVLVKSATPHTANLASPTETSLIVGVHLLNETVTTNAMLLVQGEGVLQMNACTLESTPIDVGQGALVDLQGGRYVALDCRFRMEESGDVGNFAFLQSGEDTTSMLVDCSFTAPSGLAINPNQHNVGGVINVLRNCTVKSVKYGLATNGTSTVINSSLTGGTTNLEVNWLGSSYGVSNSGNSELTILFSEIGGDIYWNKDNTNHNNVLKIGAVVFETLNESGTGSAISVVALANALSISFDNTVSSLTATNVQEAIIELEGLLGNKIESAVNVGTGEGVFKQKTGTDLELRTLLGTGGVSVSLSGTGDELEISYTGAGVSNQINQDDSSVVVTDTGVLATIDFTINATNEWRIDGVGDLLSMNGGALGSSTSYIPSLYLEALQWDVTAGVTVSEGQMAWNETAGTMDIGLKGGNVTLQVGQEEVFRCVNDDSVQINDGQAVFISGANGASGILKVQRASYDTVNAHSCVGLATENLTYPNGQGFVTTFGLVRGIDTSGLTGVVGDPVYLEANGDLTTVKPDAAVNIDHRTVEIGYLVKKSAGNGQIFVRVRDVHLESWQEDASGNLLPLQNNTFNIGSPSYIVNSIYANAYNSIRFIDPSTTEEFHFRVDQTSSSPRMKIGDMFVASIPDQDSDHFGSLPPTTMGGLTANSTIFFFDYAGNGNHLFSETTQGQSQIFFGTQRIPILDILNSDDAHDTILSSDDAHDLLMYDPTTGRFVTKGRNTLDLPYANLTGKPVALSDFTNDVGFLTSVGSIDYQTISNTPNNLSDFNNDLTISYNALSNRPTLFDGNYTSLSGTPTIPTKLSELQNDSFFGDEIHFSVAPTTGQGLFYDQATNKWVPTNQSDIVVDYTKLENKPVLFSGDYNDLSSLPNLFDGNYSSLTGSPPNVSIFANDAQYISSVDYADITNTPSIPTNVSALTNDSGYLTEVGVISYNDLTDKPTLFDSDYNSLSNQPSLFSGVYNDLTGKPTIPTQVNQLSFPSGSNGDLLSRDGADVEFVSKTSLASELHIDDIYDDVTIVEATNGKNPIAQYGYLHLVRLIKENISLELPSATSVGIYRTITIKLVERVSEFTLTIKPAAGEEIDNSTNSIVWGGGELLRSMTLYSDGTAWWVI